MLIVPFTITLPLAGASWQSRCTFTLVVACAITENGADVPAHWVVPFEAVADRVSV